MILLHFYFILSDPGNSTAATGHGLPRLREVKEKTGSPARPRLSRSIHKYSVCFFLCLTTTDILIDLFRQTLGPRASKFDRVLRLTSL